MFVQDLMSRGVVTVRTDDTLEDAKRLLIEHNIHHLFVMKDRTLVGVLSYGDLIGRENSELVGDAMSRDIVKVTARDSVREAAAKMLGHSHGCVAVMDGPAVTGILTTSDLMNAVGKRPRRAAPHA